MQLSRRRRTVAVLAGLALAAGLPPPPHPTTDRNWDKQWGMKAPAARLVVAKVFNGATADQADVIAGIKWVVDHGAKVVNLSLGGAVFVAAATFGSELTEGVEYAWKHGAVPVVASGNDDLFGAGVGSSQYGNMDALVVGATGHDGKTAEYSSPTGNAKWAVLAPGGSNTQTETDDIYSTIWKKGKPNSYGYLAG